MQFIAFLLALYGIHDIALSLGWTSFGLSVGGFKLHWDVDVMFSARYGIEML